MLRFITRGEYRGGNAGARGPGIQIFEDMWSRSDYLLAAAQTCLAFVCLAATYLEPPPLDWHLPTLRLMFLFYIAFSLLVVFLIRVMSRVAKSLEVPIHVVGVLWVSGISLATGGDGSPFFLVFIALLLISAAYRWGLHWTVATAAVCITLGFLGQLVARLWMPAFAPRLPGNWGWSGFVAGKEPGFRPENRRVRLEIDTKEEPVFSLRLGTPKRLHGMRQGFGIRASYAKPELRVGSGKGFLLRDVAR